MQSEDLKYLKENNIESEDQETRFNIDHNATPAIPCLNIDQLCHVNILHCLTAKRTHALTCVHSSEVLDALFSGMLSGIISVCTALCLVVGEMREIEEMEEGTVIVIYKNMKGKIACV